MGDDRHASVIDREVIGQSVTERAALVTNLGAENLEAVFAQGLFSAEPGDPLRRLVERRDDAVLVDGEHAVADTVENDPCGIFLHPIYRRPAPRGRPMARTNCALGYTVHCVTFFDILP